MAVHDMDAIDMLEWKRFTCRSCNQWKHGTRLRRGDILFLHMSKSPIRSGEIVAFRVEGREIPIVHRVIEVHERQGTDEIYFLTKGDNNEENDRYGIYPEGQKWLQHHHVIGRIVGFLPYAGWVTIILNEKPIIKYLLFGLLAFWYLLEEMKLKPRRFTAANNSLADH